jgi:TonB-linked SusC/RagA family outer membrane protein
VTLSDDNSPLPGVNIVVKGTTNGTVTDGNGEYKISVTGDGVLIFSFVGMLTQEISAQGRTAIDIQMSADATQLSEIVVTGFQNLEKRGLPYSVGEVKGDDIAQTQRPNFMVALQGRVAGLSMISTSGVPGSSTSITLRGVGSITGSNQPLIIIDGLPVDNRVFDQHNLVSNGDNRNNDYVNRAADVNPNDIASVTVLKGPQAAALYGQGGASGAIVITTKKGAAGSARITYDNNFGFQKLYRFPETQKIYGRGDFGYDNPTQEELNYFGAKYPTDAKIYDNAKSFYQTGASQNHNLSIEGGTENLTNRLAVNYFSQDGVVPENKYDKFSARLTSSTKFSNKLDVTTTFNYIFTNNQKPLRGSSGFLFGVLAWPVTDDMSNYLNVDGTRRRLIPDKPHVVSPATNAITYAEPNNPFFTVNKNRNTDKTNRMLANISLGYDPFSWLKVTGRLGADIYSTQGNTFLHPEGAGQVVVNSAVPAPFPLQTIGSVENYFENSRLINGQFLITGKKEFGNFKTSLMVGSTFDDKNYEANAELGTTLLLKEFNSLNNTTPNTRNFKQTLIRQRSFSVLGQLNVSYMDLVYLDVTARNDWSSTLPVENNSYFYPSVGLSFVFTELNFLKNNSILSYGKIRASYAQVGKDAPPYKVQASLINRSYTGGGFAYDFYGSNPDLKPEQAKGYELGTELKFLNSRIGLDFALFKNDRLNQISTQRLSYGTGYIFGLLNGGNISVQGFELQLTGSPIVNKDFEWEVMVNLSHSKSKVIELPAEVKEYYNSDTWLYANARGSAFPANMQTFFTGSAYPYYNWSYLQNGLGSGTAIGGQTYERNQNGDILINPASGLPIKTSDFLPIGDRNPDYLIGLTNSFKYKSVNLSFLLDIRRGGDIFNANEMYLFAQGLSTKNLDRETPRVITGVLKDGMENTATPTVNTIAITPYTMGSTYGTAFAESDFVEKDINWVRLRDVTLAYMLPSQLLTKVKPIRSASIFVTATDLFLITNYTGADPMVNGTTPATSGAGAFGFDFGSLSIPRSISAGIRIGL